MFDRRRDDHPEEDAAPPRRSAWFVLQRTWREFGDDGGTDLAAALTYYAVLAVFPGLLALLALVGMFGQAQESVARIQDVLRPLVSPELYTQIGKVLDSLVTAPGSGWALVIGVLGALWSASGYVGAFARAMNRVYEVDEGRPFWRIRPMQVVVTVATVVLCAVGLFILIVSGPLAQSLGDVLGIGNDLLQVWNVAKWPLLAAVVMVVVGLLYWVTPNVDFTRFRLISVGSFVAIVVWIVASVGFAYYVASFGSYNKTYGSVAGVVVALLWLWITNVALLFGAELDAELERGRQLQIGVAAEEELQLPVRDTRGIQKALVRRSEDVARQRDIRLAAAGPGDPADRPFGRR